MPAHRIGRLAQIPRGEGRNFTVAGQRVAVFHLTDGQVFATQPECPHLGGPLADGLTGTDRGAGSVVCPLHDRAYDLRSGAGLNSGCRIATYPVEVGPDGTLLVTLG